MLHLKKEEEEEEGCPQVVGIDNSPLLDHEQMFVVTARNKKGS
jgi:hypothetical protein